MLKLMKYELRKTAFSKLVLLVITAVAEIAFLIGVFWKKDNILAMGIIFLVMCTIFGVIYIGIESKDPSDSMTEKFHCLFGSIHGKKNAYWKVCPPAIKSSPAHPSYS